MDSKALTRQDVVALVLRGDWTPKRAEAWAKRQGLAPFAGSPDPNSYTPKCEANWTLFMALAWIVHRDMGKVREVWPEFVGAHKYWAGKTDEDGNNYWQLLSASQCEFDFYDGDVAEFFTEPTAALNDFRRKLSEGVIIATGLDNSKSLRRKIEPLELIDICFIKLDEITVNIESNVYRPETYLYISLGGPAFSRVLVKSADVVATYPPIKGEPINIVARSLLASEESSQELVNRTKAKAASEELKRLFPSGRPPMTRNELIRKLKENAPTIGSISARTMTRAIGLAWPSAAPKRAS